MVDVDYRNTLPLPPVPKLLKALPSMSALCDYRLDSLESELRPYLLTTHTLLSRIHMDDDDAYGKEAEKGSMAPPPPPKDAQLFKDDDVPEEVARAQKLARLTEPTDAYHRQAFGLQLPQLITNDVFTERQRFTTGTCSWLWDYCARRDATIKQKQRQVGMLLKRRFSAILPVSTARRSWPKRLARPSRLQRRNLCILQSHTCCQSE